MTRTMRHAVSTSVPKAIAEHHQRLVALTDTFCRDHLDEEYAELARRAAAALCRKRPSPLLSGGLDTWACAIVYALGQVNFLGDRSSSPHMTMRDLCARFGVAASTAGNKAKAVGDAIGIRQWDHRWLLRKNHELGLVWYIEVNGLVIDVRGSPRPLQVAAHERGLIPYVPADGPEGDAGIREKILQRYDRYRAINTKHQSALARKLLKGSIAGTAVRLGLVKAECEAMDVGIEDIASACDLALYRRAADGTNAVTQYLQELPDSLPEAEKRVLNSMCSSVFSIFRVAGCHRGAGVDLVDLVAGEKFWVVDRSIEASAPAGTELTLRLIKPDEFWIGTGVAVIMDSDLWEHVESTDIIGGRTLPIPSLNRDALAETIYRLAA
jgi:Domain of unknown function (DUF6398)